MSYARVGLVAPPLLDRERTALSECGHVEDVYYLCLHVYKRAF